MISAMLLALGGACVVAAVEPSGLVDVLVGGGDVEVAGDQLWAGLLAVDLAGDRLEERELALVVGLLVK